MDPTSFPTDNLYKFLALSGLALAGLCAWLWWKLREQANSALNAHAARSFELAQHANRCSAEINQLVGTPSANADSVIQLKTAAQRVAAEIDLHQQKFNLWLNEAS